jgi:hypothetical protein
MYHAASLADVAVNAVMDKYARGKIPHEPGITGELIGRLDAAFDGYRTDELTWEVSQVNSGSGAAAEESRVGADLIIYVKLETPTHKYSKGVMIQAKRVMPGQWMPQDKLDVLVGQCKTMMDFSPAAFVMNYAPREARFASATKIAGITDRELHRQCDMSALHFFFDLFVCTIGDARIVSADSATLRVHDRARDGAATIMLTARGEFEDEEDYDGEPPPERAGDEGKPDDH